MANKVQKQPSKVDQTKEVTEYPTGMLTPIVRYLFKIIGLMVICFFISLIAEWCGMLFNWWDQPLAMHSKQVAMSYVQLLNDDIRNTDYSYLISPVKPFLWLEQASMKFIGYSFSDLFNIDVYVAETGKVTQFLTHILLATGYVFVSYVVKISYFFSAFPIMALLILQFGADGYVFRTIKIFNGQLGSDWLLKVSKSIVGLGLFTLSIIFFVVPVYVHPLIAIIPISLITAIGFRALVINFAKFF